MSDDESRDEVYKQLHKNYYFDDGVTKWPIVYPIAASGSRQVGIMCNNMVWSYLETRW